MRAFLKRRRPLPPPPTPESPPYRRPRPPPPPTPPRRLNGANTLDERGERELYSFTSELRQLRKSALDFLGSAQRMCDAADAVSDALLPFCVGNVDTEGRADRTPAADTDRVSPLVWRDGSRLPSTATALRVRPVRVRPACVRPLRVSALCAPMACVWNGRGLCLKTMRTRSPYSRLIFCSVGATRAQKGHSKSENSTIVTGALSGPSAGAPPTSTL